MIKPPKKRVRLSIFVKIAIPLVLSMALIQIVLVTAILPMMRPPIPPSHRGPGPHRGGPMGSPAEMVIADFKKAEAAFTANPTKESVQEVLPPFIDVVFEGKNGSWNTGKFLPSWEFLKTVSHSVSNDPNALTGFFFGRHFYSKEVKEGRMILFSPSGQPSPLFGPPFWILMAAQIAGVLIFCYAFLAWQLRPVKKLGAAMEELSKGNFDYRVALKDSGEFGILGEGFDEMAQRIASMMKAKEELMLGVSHELRSPLASINVLIEMIGDPKRKDQIRSHLLRMEALVGELLESHRIASQHQFASVSFSEVFTNLRERYEDSRVVFPSTDISAEMDRVQIDRLLSNLVENAIKYSKKEVKVRVSQANEEILIEVSDLGPGIPETDIANIFEPFYRVDKSRNRETGGFGLGLYLCAKIAALHQGKIWAVNHPEGGCSFFVLLPASQRSANRAA